MMVITLGEYREHGPNEYGHRAGGWKPGLSDEELWSNVRGRWKLGAKAERQRYVLFVAGKGATPEPKVVLAAQIRGLLVRSGTGKRDPDGRRTIDGTVLGPGHPVYEHFVGGPTPLEKTWTAVQFIDTPFDDV